MDQKINCANSSESLKHERRSSRLAKFFKARSASSISFFREGSTFESNLKSWIRSIEWKRRRLDLENSWTVSMASEFSPAGCDSSKSKSSSWAESNSPFSSEGKNGEATNFILWSVGESFATSLSEELLDPSLPFHLHRDFYSEKVVGRPKCCKEHALKFNRFVDLALDFFLFFFLSISFLLLVSSSFLLHSFFVKLLWEHEEL